MEEDWNTGRQTEMQVEQKTEEMAAASCELRNEVLHNFEVIGLIPIELGDQQRHQHLPIFNLQVVTIVLDQQRHQRHQHLPIFNLQVVSIVLQVSFTKFFLYFFFLAVWFTRMTL
ncbi:hypothetical protein AQUCO_01100244v1 [Aquilegia coerulea]|uniref:Uncharacterized protein n=1 Tax=Aquilegia coerulea TaxID=218851 RepID=A0A2G5E686_AQUCA|nr:hypothetical protein AQUCO_01100244v1 [Aquilegia coerulea]